MITLDECIAWVEEDIAIAERYIAMDPTENDQLQEDKQYSHAIVHYLRQLKAVNEAGAKVMAMVDAETRRLIP